MRDVIVEIPGSGEAAVHPRGDDLRNPTVPGEANDRHAVVMLGR